MTKTRTSESISTRIDKIAQVAQKYRDRALTPLSHHIDMIWLEEAHRRTRKDGAAGVDDLSMAEYGNKLEENLQGLLDRAKSGRYRAPPVKRVYIPKASGDKLRPIGIPTAEDKILQRAVTMVLEAVYEQEFYDFSYGFRAGRGAHDALFCLREQLMSMGGGWVLEADIEGFFDAVDHKQLRDILSQRIGDGMLMRLIGKWLKAGVMEEGRHRRSETGTPQGGVISPMLANIYLHEVLDRWFDTQVAPRLIGKAQVVRYADDFVIMFTDETDARRVLDVLPKRFGKFGLRLHPEKTRLLPFKSPKKSQCGESRKFRLPEFSSLLG